MKRGFTLMEILVALLVVSIGIVSIIGVLVSTLDTNSKARDDINMVSFADMVLNALHAEDDWNSIPTSGNLFIHDYDENTAPISLGQQSQFTSDAIGKDRNSTERFTVTYQLDLTRNQDNTVITAELQIWPGHAANGNPRFFQTELYNWRKP